VVEVRERQIREILTEIVPNWDPVSTVYDEVNQLERFLAFDFAPDYLFEHFVVNAWIKLPYVNLQAIPRLFCIFHRALDTAHRTVNAAFLNARICITRED
jgi:hypothetical protein